MIGRGGGGRRGRAPARPGLRQDLGRLGPRSTAPPLRLPGRPLPMSVRPRPPQCAAHQHPRPARRHSHLLPSRPGHGLPRPGRYRCGVTAPPAPSSRGRAWQCSYAGTGKGSPRCCPRAPRRSVACVRCPAKWPGPAQKGPPGPGEPCSPGGAEHHCSMGTGSTEGITSASIHRCPRRCVNTPGAGPRRYDLHGQR